MGWMISIDGRSLVSGLHWKNQVTTSSFFQNVVGFYASFSKLWAKFELILSSKYLKLIFATDKIYDIKKAPAKQNKLRAQLQKITVRWTSKSENCLSTAAKFLLCQQFKEVSTKSSGGTQFALHTHLYPFYNVEALANTTMNFGVKEYGGEFLDHVTGN